MYFDFFVAIAAATLNFWENVLVVGITAAVKDSNDVTIGLFTQRSKCRFEIVERNLLRGVRQHDLALVSIHHAVTAVVNNGECLLVRVGVLDNPLSEFGEHLFCLISIKVRFLEDVHIFVKAELLDIAAEHFHVILDCW